MVIRIRTIAYGRDRQLVDTFSTSASAYDFQALSAVSLLQNGKAKDALWRRSTARRRPPTRSRARTATRCSTRSIATPTTASIRANQPAQPRLGRDRTRRFAGRHRGHRRHGNGSAALCSRASAVSSTSSKRWATAIFPNASTGTESDLLGRLGHGDRRFRRSYLAAIMQQIQGASVTVQSSEQAKQRHSPSKSTAA